MNKRVIFFASAAVLTVLAAVLCLSFGGGAKADIYLDGRLIESVSLSVEREFTVETESGFNKIAVKDGRIGVIEADCPDRTCVNTGMTDNSFLPVICLPHKLEIIVSGR